MSLVVGGGTLRRCGTFGATALPTVAPTPPPVPPCGPPDLCLGQSLNSEKLTITPLEVQPWAGSGGVLPKAGFVFVTVRVRVAVRADEVTDAVFYPGTGLARPYEQPRLVHGQGGGVREPALVPAWVYHGLVYLDRPIEGWVTFELPASEASQLWLVGIDGYQYRLLLGVSASPPARQPRLTLPGNRDLPLVASFSAILIDRPTPPAAPPTARPGTFVRVVSADTMCQTAAECVLAAAEPFGGLVREVRDERELVRRCREGLRGGVRRARAEPPTSSLPPRVPAHRRPRDGRGRRPGDLSRRLPLDREGRARPSLSPWLNTIVLRTAGRAGIAPRSRPGPSLDQAIHGSAWLRRPRPPTIGEGMIDLDPTGDPHAAAEAAELRRDLAAALIELPFKYRAAVVLRHVMGLDYAEAARQMDVPLNTFKSHLLRGTRTPARGACRPARTARSRHRPPKTLPRRPSAHGLGSGNGRRPGELVVGIGATGSGAEPRLVGPGAGPDRPRDPRVREAPATFCTPHVMYVDVTNPHVGHALDCARARALIDAFLLDELGPADAARLAAHVKGCAACTAEIGSSTRVLGLLGSLTCRGPRRTSTSGSCVAALDDRARRRAHRSWLSDLRTQVIRGAMRTTGHADRHDPVRGPARWRLRLRRVAGRRAASRRSAPECYASRQWRRRPFRFRLSKQPSPRRPRHRDRARSFRRSPDRSIISPTPSTPPPSSPEPVSPTPEPSASPTPSPPGAHPDTHAFTHGRADAQRDGGAHPHA